MSLRPVQINEIASAINEAGHPSTEGVNQQEELVRKFRVAASAMALAGALALSACEHATFYSGVTIAPPPLRVVGPVGVAPSPGFVWTDGWYDWGGSSWMWRPGRWQRPPHPGWRWQRPVYQPWRGGMRVHPGHWAR